MAMITTYNKAVADKIVEQLTAGNPMAEICRSKGMPCVGTVRSWGKTNKEFAERVAQARLDGADAIAADTLRIADERNELDQDDVQHRKLRIHTRLQLLAKWDPKRYGDKLDLNHSGSIGIADTLKAAREVRKKATEK